MVTTLIPAKISIYNPATSETKYYPIDTSFEPYRREAFRHRTIAPQREGVMMTNIVGEGTVSTEGLWRREQVEWTMGAGQYSLDRRGDNQETRFYSSKGVDVFSFPFQATLLPDTHRKDSGTVYNNLVMARCGDYVVTADSNAGTTYVTRFDSSWTSLTFNYDTTTYGGSAPTVVNSITSNDSYVFIATDTGVWFCDPSVLVTGHPTLQLFAAPDLASGYTGGYDMIRWANDQLLGSRGARLYAFQPRSASGGITYGSSPSVSAATVAIASIQGSGSFFSVVGQSIVNTSAPHGFTTGQQVTIQDTKLTGYITSFTVGSGLVNITCANTHGLSVGQQVTITLPFSTGKIITETVTVSSVSSTDGTKFSYPTRKVNANTNYSTGNGTFISSENGYGYNNTYAVLNSNQFSALTITSVAGGSPTSGEVTYTYSGIYQTATVGAVVVVAGLTPAGYNGMFTVIAAGGTSGSWTFTVLNATTGAASGSGTATPQSQSFSIATTKNAGFSATGGSITVPANADVLYTHQNSKWVWSDATGGETQVYFGGYVKSAVGSRSGCIYRSNLLGSSTTVPSGIATITNSSVAQPWQLDSPVQALPMAPDEYPTCVKSYLNYVFVGTNRGIRMTQTLSVYDPTATATGDLKAGPLIPNVLQPLTYPVTGIVGDGRFVWFAWNDYDAASTGLGKLDLSTYIAGDQLAPAYASDIMVAYAGSYSLSTGQGIINSLDWDATTQTPLLALGGQGLYGPYATNSGGNQVVSQYVTSGTITSGVFDYGIPDPKIPLTFTYGAVNSASSSVSASIVLDPGDAGTSTIAVASYASGGTPEVSINSSHVTAKQFQTVITLTAGSSAATTPALHRWTLKAWPCVVQGTLISVVCRMFSVNIADGLEEFLDPYAEFYWLETRRVNQDIVTYTEGSLSVTCVVYGMDMIPHEARDDYSGGFEGDIVLTLHTIGQYVYTEQAT